MRSRGSKQLRNWFANSISPIIRSGGFPVMPTSFGKAFFVNPDHTRATDTNNPGTDPEKPLSTVSKAYELMTSNAGDIAYCSDYSTHTLTEMLTVSKNRCHFVGMGPLREYGQGCKVSLGNTGVATDIGTIKVTGVRCSFTNMKILNSNEVAEGIYSFIDGGEYTKVDHCEITKSTDLNVTGAAELVCNGDSSQYLNCFIGSVSYATTGAIIRACVLMTREIISGKVARDVTFRNCTFARNCGNAAGRFVYGAEATSIERMGRFEDCTFWNAKSAAAVPAQNVAFGSSLTDGEVLLNNCVAMNAATAMSTTTGVFVNGPNQTTAAGGAEIGIALQAS